eukprot:Ihof_evm14s50 gene=Ihof_evmTU14s50
MATQTDSNNKRAKASDCPEKTTDQKAQHRKKSKEMEARSQDIRSFFSKTKPSSADIGPLLKQPPIDRANM